MPSYTVRRRVSGFWPCCAVAILLFLLFAGHASTLAAAQSGSPSLPELTAPVNDFAHVIDPDSAREMDRMIRELKDKTGDVVIVATVPSLAGFGDIREYATKLFENHGRGVGDKEKDNGLLLLVAPNDRRVWVEVGYGLEQWITDGFAGETSRDFMAPEFRQGRFGPGILAGATRIIGRIAQGRNVQLTGVEPPRAVSHPRTANISIGWIILFLIVVLVIGRMGGGPGRPVQRWGRRGWSGWSSGVGPFGGGFGGFGGGGFGGGGGGGFGGGFGGFGGGGSGGGGGGSSW